MSESTSGTFSVRNKVRERIADGEVAFGMGVRLVRSGEIALIAAAADYDFLYVDTQHAVFDSREIVNITQAALGSGIAPFVRVRSSDDPDISVLLDAGVIGIVAPDIVSAEQARRLVEVTKYAPTGHRSLSGFTPHSGYAPVPVEEQLRVENESVMLFCMIESAEGLAAIDEIGAVPGVDGLYLGLADLLSDLDAPGRFDGPEVGRALDALIATTTKYGLVAGSGGAPTPALQSRAIRAGVRYLMASADIGLVRSGAGAAIDAVVSALGYAAQVARSGRQ